MPDVRLHGSGIAIDAAPQGPQWLLQCRAEDAADIAAAAGITLGTTMLASNETCGWDALHLSPDEWLLIAGEDADAALPDHVLVLDQGLSMVEVSDRSFGLRLSGPAAAELLAGACPLDLERVGDGGCTPNLLGKATMLLWRRGADWQISYSRSYHDYVMALLTELVADLAPA